MLVRWAEASLCQSEQTGTARQGTITPARSLRARAHLCRVRTSRTPRIRTHKRQSVPALGAGVPVAKMNVRGGAYLCVDPKHCWIDCVAICPKHELPWPCRTFPTARLVATLPVSNHDQ